MGMTVVRGPYSVALVAFDFTSPGYLTLRHVTGCGLQTDGVLSARATPVKAEGVFSQVLRPYSGKASFGRWMCSKR